MNFGNRFPLGNAYMWTWESLKFVLIDIIIKFTERRNYFLVFYVLTAFPGAFIICKPTPLYEHIISFFFFIKNLIKYSLWLKKKKNEKSTLAKN